MNNLDQCSQRFRSAGLMAALEVLEQPSGSLSGQEDRSRTTVASIEEFDSRPAWSTPAAEGDATPQIVAGPLVGYHRACLLYTSDAADE